jgi:hypothetical protein
VNKVESLKLLLPVAFALAVHCVGTAPMVGPGNAIGGLGGPQSQGGSGMQTRQQQLLFGGAKTAAEYSTSLPGNNSLPLFIAAYTIPVAVTDHPRGPVSLDYSTFCVLYVCIGGGDAAAELQGPSRNNPLVAIHSVDATVISYFLGTYTTRAIRINGWTKQAWEKEFGGAAPTVSGFDDVVELKDGQILTGVKAAVTTDSVVVITTDGRSMVFQKAQVKSVRKR